ncbi:bifunctional deaminase-reductase domain protein [Kribbella flavida DSM 17836]|uniref:Bifunctional deaminase-reductase domain protein n=1 Tax=Kribbella flavida (strain DSM 17836 / JCM 10339 / NBRC 14399) TaxID=479435 RepID=D2Q398_KRIFD|nr:dihydrofolate reductase family protein [Kribbella flavida]ADB32223.1 bifunctional deaminase-reductase domain protein [Kribbella flavida DSM 17836]
MELSVNTFVSLDGVMQAPGAVQEDQSNGFERGGWLVPHSTEGQLDPVDGWFRQADAFLLGRTTFEMMRTYWSQVTEPDNLVATALNEWPKYVVSTTLSDEDAAWGNTTVLRGDIVEQVRKLKEQDGKELQVHGSWQLARTLHDAGLVDTYRLLQFPVVVGDGKRLFAAGVPSTYRITEAEVLRGGAGVVSLTLRQDQFGTVGNAGEFAVTEDGRETIV